MLILEIALVFFIGTALGSFASALAYRVPRGIKWWGATRSKCPNCNTALSFRDLLPIFSWLASKGRCRHCNKSIHFRYPLIEVFSGFLALLAFLSFGFAINFFFVLLILPFLFALFVIDLEEMILPNQLILILLFIGALRLLFYAPVFLIPYYIAAAVVYAGTIWILSICTRYFLKKEVLGFGDVKFFAVVGLWLGFVFLPYFMILSGLLAVLFAVIWAWRYGSEIFPFGPALILSFYILLVFGGSLV